MGTNRNESSGVTIIKGRDTNIIVSTNDLRTVIKTPTASKKPNQVKRKRTERLRTPSSKRKLKLKSEAVVNQPSRSIHTYADTK